MKKVLSLLLAICMTVVVCIPSVSAAEPQYVGLDSVPIDDMGLAEYNPTSSSKSVEDGIDPQVIVSEGTNAFITRISVYPAFVDGGEIKFASSLAITETFPGNWTGGTLRASPAETKDKLDQFLKGVGRPAELWLMEVHYDVINDRWGSYGKYFEFSPEGNLVFPDKTSTGKVRYDLKRTNVDTGYSLLSAFTIPQNATEEYKIGLYGGFWYYNIKANKTLNHSAHASAFFNSTF